MRCSNCGEPIEEGRLFCLNCGQEVQWVPDYDSFGDYMVQEKLKKENQLKNILVMTRSCKEDMKNNFDFFFLTPI